MRIPGHDIDEEALEAARRDRPAIWKELRKLWRETGCCTQCGNRMAREGGRRCEECAGRDRSRQQKRRARFKRLGRCAICGYRSDGQFLCAFHAKKLADNLKRQRAAKIAKGECLYCDQRALENKQLCSKHLQRQRGYLTAWRKRRQTKHAEKRLCRACEKPLSTTERFKACESCRSRWRVYQRQRNARLCSKCRRNPRATQGPGSRSRMCRECARFYAGERVARPKQSQSRWREDKFDVLEAKGLRGLVGRRSA